jgi:hypothetical protein
MIDDPLIRWARQDDRPGVRVWSTSDAVAVACPDLSRRDRLAVRGPVDAVADLLTEVLPEVGPTYRPLGDEDLITAVADRLPGLEPAGRFGWMETKDQIHGGTGDWLPDSKGVGDLLEAAFPNAEPTRSGNPREKGRVPGPAATGCGAGPASGTEKGC